MVDKNYDIPGEAGIKPLSDLERAGKKERALRRINSSLSILEEALTHPSANRIAIARKLILLKNYDPVIGKDWIEKSREYDPFEGFDFFNACLNGTIKSAKNRLEAQKAKIY